MDIDIWKKWDAINAFGYPEKIIKVEGRYCLEFKKCVMIIPEARLLPSKDVQPYSYLFVTFQLIGKVDYENEQFIVMTSTTNTIKRWISATCKYM